MKLRIKGDSLRLRITPSEMKRFLSEGRIEETIHFAADASARLVYALEHSVAAAVVTVRYAPGELTVMLPTVQAREWAMGEETGVYGGVQVGSGLLEIAVEKDWACLDQSDRENEDAFPNPNQDAVC